MQQPCARFLAPLANPSKVLCVGLNYESHLAELEISRPSEPTVFAKFSSAIIGDGDLIRLPAAAPLRVDYEAELAVLIGRRGRDIAQSTAMDWVAGYTVGNDLSARDWQLRKPNGQWTLGKSFDTFLPLGPAMATKDEVSDVCDLRLKCTIGDLVVQDASSKEMLFSIPEIIEYVSRVCTLEAGDLILTGSPGGTAIARTPPRYLRAGDSLCTSIKGIGTLWNPVELAEGVVGR
jgi:2-keto-4-pentenoate hydratase/2-oxohepta-3-ene-1,7-dioic acid hydratase in catechol pathway